MNKEDKKEFLRAEEYKLIFDMTETNYFGMDSIEFIEYYSAKNNMTPENFSVILKYIGKELEKDLNNITKKRISQSSNSEYVIHISLDEITPNAGLQVTVNTYVKDPTNGEINKLTVKDGRWNKFDILLQENVFELAKKISKETILKKHTIGTFTMDNYEDPIYR